jgi:CRISPR-associated protein Csb1
MPVASALDQLLDERFLALDVELEPIGSPTFHVTTFANTGPSFYVDREGQLSAVVDSVASVANQLEATVWDDAALAPVEAVAALPWVRVVDGSGATYTTSRTAAHRLNAHALINAVDRGTGEAMESKIRAALGEAPAPPIAHRLASVAWSLDPFAVLHGLWWPGEWGGRARLTRALTGRIDAHDVQTQAVQVGGQKTADHVAEVGVKQRGAEGKTVEGDVPAYLSEVSARRIVGRFLLDVRLLRSYALPPEATRALLAAALLELGEMLEAWPRRRSRCALDPVDPDRARRARTPDGFALPSIDTLRELAAEACRAATGEDGAAVREVVYRPRPRKKSGDAPA